MTEPAKVYNRRNPRDTSLAAATRVRAGTAKAKVLAAIQECPRTDAEIIKATGLNPNTARPRRVDLVESGLVVDSGVRRRRMIVWTVVEHE